VITLSSININDLKRLTLVILDKRNNNKNKTLIKSIKLLIPSRHSSILILFFSIIGLVLSIGIGFNSNTINLFSNVVKGINNILLVILGLNFTGYALFYSMASGKTHINLLSSESDIPNTSIFDFYNTYFFGLSTLYLLAILFNFLLHSIIDMLSPNFSLPLALLICNILASLLIMLYLIIMIWLIIAFSASIFNLYRGFNINASIIAVEYLDKHSKDKDNV
jgi:hypothetical protein